MYEPTSLVRELFPSRHEKLELPCMNDTISRKLNRKIRRFSYTFNMRSNQILRAQSPEAVTLRTFRWFIIKQVPLRVKPSTYILAQIRSYRNTSRIVSEQKKTKTYSAKQDLRLTIGKQTNSMIIAPSLSISAMPSH